MTVVGLVAAGAVLLALSAYRTSSLLGVLPGRYRPVWLVLLSLIVAVFTGYLGVMVVVALGEIRTVLLVTGVVFLLGAAFVALTVNTGHRTIDDLLETSVSKEHLDDIFGTMTEPLAIVSPTPDRSVTGVNPALSELVGRSHDDLVGRPLADIVTPTDHDQLAAAFETVLEQGTATDVELHYQCADGEVVPVLFSAAAMRTEGRVEAVVCTARDISRQRAQEERLRQQNEQLESFASTASHDLRNPLAIASGHLEIARRTGADHSFDRVEEAHERMRSLIDDLLWLARNGRVVGETHEVSLETAVRSAWSSVAAVDGSLELADDLGVVEADPTTLRTALENLLRNAVEHGGPSVRVTASSLEDAPGFVIEDNGPGLPDDRPSVVFEQGYTTLPGGTGLGLDLVRSTVEAHGWEIRATESDLGGARFEIHTLPEQSTADPSGPDTGPLPTDLGEEAS